MASESKRYSKLLVARLSPPNRCFGPEGATLVPALPTDDAPFRRGVDQHFFVDVETGTANLFGWVAEARQSLTVGELVELDHFRSAEAGLLRAPPDLEWYASFLEALARQPVGTPMGCSWLEVKLPGVEKRVLKTHKVLFYPAAEQGRH